MKNIIPVSSDLTLVKIKNKGKQPQLFLNLLNKNKKRLLPFFPGLYHQEITLKNIQNLLKEKEKKFNTEILFSYALCSKKAKRIIGELSFSNNYGSGALSYWVDAPFEGKGIISKAFDKLRDEAFNNGIEMLYASCDVSNNRSLCFLQKKGFKIFEKYPFAGQRIFYELKQRKQDYLFQQKERS